MIEMEPLASDTVMLRRAFGCFPSGIVAVCALVGGVPVGMAASAFTPVSLDPPLVSLCVQHTSTTWPSLRTVSRIGSSVLSEEQADVCTSLSTRGIERFADVDWDASQGGSVFVRGASLWLDCTIESEIEAGDHSLALLRAHGVSTADAPPLVFHGSTFRKLAAVG